MDALTLADLDRRFDSVIDSGLFHVFSDEDRARYVAGLAHVTRPGGRLFLLCFSDEEPGTQGPRRVSQREIREAFADGWDVEEIRAGEVRGPPRPEGHLVQRGRAEGVVLGDPAARLTGHPGGLRGPADGDATSHPPRLMKEGLVSRLICSLPLVGLLVVGAAGLAPAAENAVLNGDFRLWATRREGGVTTTSVGTPPGSLPDGWYGGPGVGATASYDVVAGATGEPGEVPPGRLEDAALGRVGGRGPSPARLPVHLPGVLRDHRRPSVRGQGGRGPIPGTGQGGDGGRGPDPLAQLRLADRGGRRGQGPGLRAVRVVRQARGSRRRPGRTPPRGRLPGDDLLAAVRQAGHAPRHRRPCPSRPATTPGSGSTSSPGRPRRSTSPRSRSRRPPTTRGVDR